MTPAVVIWNRGAGGKVRLVGAPMSEDELRAVLDRHGVSGTIEAPEGVDGIAAAARRAREAGTPRIVAAGGDGTIGIVAEQLLGGESELGIVPLGSIMNIPRMLGIPRDIDAAVSGLASWPARRIDVGLARGRVFFEVGSVGVSASVFAQVQRAADGDLRGIAAAVRAAFRYRPARMQVVMTEETVATGAMLVTVANGPYTGAAFTVAPDASLDDGLFDVHVYGHFSKLDLVRHFASIALGRRAYAPQLRTYRSNRVRIDAARPLPCRADGEDSGTTPIEFEVARAALSVVAPAAGEAAPA